MIAHAISRRIATMGPVGWIGPAPGTSASLVTCLLAWPLFTATGVQGLAAAAVIVTVFGVWTSDQYCKKSGVADPSEVVIDEAAGQLLALAAIGPEGWTDWVAAFFLFRAFDIVKPWPISRLERFPGGLGVMLDDLAAGLATAAVVWVIGLIGF
ncbi:MAG: phosphatidylglycerophosphatase A [Maricaulaceae bacterium]